MTSNSTAFETFSAKAVETFQVRYDTLPQATGTTERLREGQDVAVSKA
jgi:hypothetical protein